MNSPTVPEILDAHVFEALFDQTDEGICVVRVLFDEGGEPRDFEYVKANAAFERMTGLVDVRGRRVGDVSTGQPDHWADILADVARTGESLQMCDYSPRLGLWFKGHVFRVGGQDEGVVAVRFDDITELRRVHGRLASIYRINTVGVMFWGEGFGLKDMNEGFLQMTGFTRDEALHRTWEDFTPPEFHEISAKAMWEVLNRGESTPYEKQYLRKDEFLATLAHELRNPLAPIRTGLHIMRLSAAPEGAALRTIDMMDRQLGHLVRLVDDLLDVARITAGKVRIEKRVISLRDVLARSIEATQAAIETRKHTLELDMPPGEVCVDGDLDRLAQVFSNLLSNAAKYTPPRGKIRVEVTTTKTDVLVSVSDNGVGIPVEQQSLVFDLFTQVRDHQTNFEGGLGIGLSLVQSLVRLHDGCVWLESKGPGQGSRFCVRLPRVEPGAHGRAAPTAPAPGAQPHAPIRIVVADDNIDAAETLAMLLRVGGHEVAVASNGREAVEQVEAFAPDLVLLDLGMPVMGGVEAARVIRAGAGGANIRLVALTGWGQPSDRERTREAGFDLHLVKPITPQDLETAVALVPRR